jgi:hypothetical protein
MLHNTILALATPIEEKWTPNQLKRERGMYCLPYLIGLSRILQPSLLIRRKHMGELSKLVWLAAFIKQVMAMKSTLQQTAATLLTSVA